MCLFALIVPGRTGAEGTAAEVTWAVDTVGTGAVTPAHTVAVTPTAAGEEPLADTLTIAQSYTIGT